jgi:hypothetical protein
MPARKQRQSFFHPTASQDTYSSLSKIERGHHQAKGMVATPAKGSCKDQIFGSPFQ